MRVRSTISVVTVNSSERPSRVSRRHRIAESRAESRESLTLFLVSDISGFVKDLVCKTKTSLAKLEVLSTKKWPFHLLIPGNPIPPIRLLNPRNPTPPIHASIS